MGDRGNIVVQAHGQRVYLYTHNQGYEVQEIAARALRRNQRWDDPSYLTRIIFCEMVKGRESTETGFGIWPTLGDNSHPLVIIDVDSQKVYLESDDGTKEDHGWTFDTFSKMFT